VNNPLDLQKGGVLVARVRLANYPVSGMHSGDERRAMRHVVVTALEIFLEFGSQWNGLDPSDGERRISLHCAALGCLT
jgi:hypothetical protein